MRGLNAINDELKRIIIVHWYIMSISTNTNAIIMNHVYDDEVRGEGAGAGGETNILNSVE